MTNDPTAFLRMRAGYGEAADADALAALVAQDARRPDAGEPDVELEELLTRVPTLRMARGYADHDQARRAEED